MSILDKISNVFAPKNEEGGEPIATPVEPVAPVQPVAPEAPEISPQPDMITPEGELPAEELVEEKSGEGEINLNI